MTIFLQDRNTLAPGGVLRVVDFSKIENLPLHNAMTAAATVLDDAPVAVFPTVFEAFSGPEKHVLSVANAANKARGKVFTTRALADRALMKSNT